MEVPWIKYKGSGPAERVLVELKRKDRLMFKKKFVYITVAISCLGVIIFLHSQITGILIAVMADGAQTGSGRLATEMHYQYHNAVTTGLAGISLFALLRALELHLSQKNINAQKIVKYKQTALVMLRWAVVLVSGDIVMQNLMGINSSIFNYSMRYQTVGALLAIELLILSRFFTPGRISSPQSSCNKAATILL